MVGDVIKGSIGMFSHPSFFMAVVLALYFCGVYWITHHCRGFWNDADGWSIDELASMLSLGVWIYVAITLALAGPNITEAQVDFFEVLTYLPLATVAKQAVRFVFRGRKGGNDMYDNPYMGNTTGEP